MTFVKYLWSFEVQQINWQVSKWAFDSAIILSLSLFHFHNFQRFYDNFVYIIAFSSCRDTLSHWYLEISIFQEKQSYILTNLLILKDLWLQMTFLSCKLSAENNFTKYDFWRSVGQFLSSHQKFGRYVFTLFYHFEIEKLFTNWEYCWFLHSGHVNLNFDNDIEFHK